MLNVAAAGAKDTIIRASIHFQDPLLPEVMDSHGSLVEKSPFHRRAT